MQAGTPLAIWSKRQSVTSIVAENIAQRAILSAIANAQIRTLASEKTAAVTRASDFMERLEQSNSIQAASVTEIFNLRASLNDANNMLITAEKSKCELLQEQERLQSTIAADAVVLEDQRMKRDTLCEELEEAISSHASFVEESNNRVAKLTSSLVQAEALQETTAAQLHEHIVVNEANGKRMEEYDAMCKHLKNQCALNAESLQALRDKSETERFEANQDRIRLEARASQLQDEVTNARDQLAAAITHRDALMNTNETIQKKLKITQALFNNEHEAVGNRTSELNQEVAKNDEMKSKHASELAMWEAKRDALEKQFTETSTKLEKEEERILNIQSECARLKSQCQATEKALQVQCMNQKVQEHESSEASKSMRLAMETVQESLKEKTQEFHLAVKSNEEMQSFGVGL
jgi:chromosome segregation ATPase